MNAETFSHTPDTAQPDQKRLYYEFIAFFASTGDVDMSVIENTIKGNLKFYYDKCAPLILSEQSANPRTMEHYSRLRDSFRDP